MKASPRILWFVVIIFLLPLFVWLVGSTNCETPAGYVGYVTQGSVFGKKQFIGTQVGPTSTGRMWLGHVINVSITPYSYDEVFKVEDNSAILTKDHMQVSFSVHAVFRIRPDRIREFLEQYSTLDEGDIVQMTYKNFVQERLRAYARDSIQQYNWQDLPSLMDKIGAEVEEKVQALTKDTPFNIESVVVGNIQFPASVTQSVAEAQAATQILSRKEYEVKQAEADARKRVAEAKGVAEAMDIINQKLTPTYLQHEAIEAQKGMINSPNHTVIYIPVGPMGVPITGTVDVANPAPATR
jgi:regulator of protease activity HflC (stomatin/prohibitin superfamily)